ncbi:MAG: DUF2007 domain-containing protein [Acidobacteriota bacterium]|nr:DUF2007 domain-containing protein [Acidobacteriota bacterium]
MIEVYRAAHPAQAHLLRGLLEAEGIEAVVIGEFSFNVRGEAPMTTDTLPRVCVVNIEDAGRARALAVEFDRGTPAVADAVTWICSQCGETIEGQFGECWKCGASRNTP